MRPTKFHSWLAQILDQSASDVSHLLSQEMAVEFLISWSLFESRCFEGFMKFDKIEPYAIRVVDRESFDSSLIAEHFDHFHDRYQDAGKRRNLLHQQKSESFMRIATMTKAAASPCDKVLFCVAVAHRFRNNMFHGNKGVGTWLLYRDQIKRCSAVIQILVSHAESQCKQIALPSRARRAN